MSKITAEDEALLLESIKHSKRNGEIRYPLPEFPKHVKDGLEEFANKRDTDEDEEAAEITVVDEATKTDEIEVVEEVAVVEETSETTVVAKPSKPIAQSRREIICGKEASTHLSTDALCQLLLWRQHPSLAARSRKYHSRFRCLLTVIM